MKVVPGTAYLMTPMFIADARRTKVLACRVVVRAVDDPAGFVLIEHLDDGPWSGQGSSRGRLWRTGDRRWRERGKWRFEAL